MSKTDVLKGSKVAASSDAELAEIEEGQEEDEASAQFDRRLVKHPCCPSHRNQAGGDCHSGDTARDGLAARRRLGGNG